MAFQVKSTQRGRRLISPCTTKNVFEKNNLARSTFYPNTAMYITCAGNAVANACAVAEEKGTTDYLAFQLSFGGVLTQKIVVPWHGAWVFYTTIVATDVPGVVRVMFDYETNDNLSRMANFTFQVAAFRTSQTVNLVLTNLSKTTTTNVQLATLWGTGGSVGGNAAPVNIPSYSQVDVVPIANKFHRLIPKKKAPKMSVAGGLFVDYFFAGIIREDTTVDLHFQIGRCSLSQIISIPVSFRDDGAWVLWATLVVIGSCATVTVSFWPDTIEAQVRVSTFALGERGGGGEKLPTFNVQMRANRPGCVTNNVLLEFYPRAAPPSASSSCVQVVKGGRRIQYNNRNNMLLLPPFPIASVIDNEEGINHAFAVLRDIPANQPPLVIAQVTFEPPQLNSAPGTKSLIVSCHGEMGGRTTRATFSYDFGGGGAVATYGPFKVPGGKGVWSFQLVFGINTSAGNQVEITGTGLFTAEIFTNNSTTWDAKSIPKLVVSPATLVDTVELSIEVVGYAADCKLSGYSFRN